MMDTGRRPALVIVDFPGRRNAGRLRDLRLDEAGFAVSDILDPTQGDTIDSSPSTYPAAVIDLARRAVGDGSNVVSVLGYCLAAPLAEAVAEALGVASLVVVEAQDVTPFVVAEEVCAVRESIRPGFCGLPEWWSDSFLGDPDMTLERIEVTLLSDIEQATSLTLDAEPSLRILLATYLDWFRFLLAMHTVRRDVDQLRCRALSVMSQERAMAINWIREGTVDSRVVDSDRASLMGLDQTRQTVLDWLIHEMVRP